MLAWHKPWPRRGDDCRAAGIVSTFTHTRSRPQRHDVHTIFFYTFLLMQVWVSLVSNINCRSSVIMHRDVETAGDQNPITCDGIIHRPVIVPGRQSLYSTRTSNSIIVFVNPFVKPPRRMNVADNAPVNTNYINMLSEQCWQGELSIQHLPKLLNPYEWACISRYRFNQPLQEHVSVFLVPNRCHMSPKSNWMGSAPSAGGLGHHAHSEMWVAFLLAAKSGRQFWLWMAKRESELLSETSYPDLKAFMGKYGRLYSSPATDSGSSSFSEPLTPTTVNSQGLS